MDNILKRIICGVVLIGLTAGITGISSCDHSSAHSKKEILNLNASSTEYPNADLLVSADSLEDSLGASNLIIVDARANTAYTAGHIPGAINMIHGDYWTWGNGLKPLNDLEAALGAAGLTREAVYVIYDDTTASWGAAGRLFWMLEYLGCPNVHILNGGWDNWIADGRPTETKGNTLAATTFISAVNADVRATKEHLRDRIAATDETDSNSDLAIIDTRTEEEYIGWQFYGEARGGNISGAVNIPYSWFFDREKKVLNYQDLKNILEEREIITTKEVIPYCTVGIRSGFAYFILRLMGYPRVANYDASMAEWSAADADIYPMDKLQKYQMIVNPDWIKALIDGGNPGTAGTPATYPGKGYVILELTSNNTEDEVDAYNAGHIPGAIHLNIRSFNLEYPVERYTYYNGKLPFKPADLAELQNKIEALGITKDTTVVLYEYYDAVWAARIAWALLYAGVEDVRILNGAWKAWVDAGYPVETESNAGVPASFGATIPVHPEYRTFIDEVEGVVAGTIPGVLGDTRSWDEYTGVKNGYNDGPGDVGFIQKGRIPGAVWVHDWDWYIHFKDYEAYRNDEGDDRLRSYTEVRKMWYQAGLDPDIRASFYCGGGYRASLSFLYGYMMGWNVSNYDGSWYEWSFNLEGNNGSDIPGRDYERGYPDYPVTW